jgi:UDP-GlcNAc:undecaprenyl-phosphate GlcNAc-1-phosphate transferase
MISPPPSATERRPAALGRISARCSWWTSLSLLGLALILLLPPVRNTWQSVYGARWAYILILAGLITSGATPLIIWIADAFGVLDVPSARKVHSTPTPLLGGLAVYLGFVAAILANSILDSQVTAILIAASLLVVVGVLDDAFELPASVKLFAQFVAVAIVISSGVVISLVPRLWLGPLVDVLLTVLWLLGITNAMNFFDGMDGLAAGLSIITGGFLGLFAYLTNQPFLGWLAAAVVGSSLGFLPFNLRCRTTAAIFLGDAGSTFLGFVLAALAIKGEWAENHLIDLAAPILIFWVFIYDMSYITVARIVRGKVRTFREWITYVGRDHLHHRLASLLGSNRKAVLLVFLFSICMGLAAIVLVRARTAEAVLLIAQAVLIAAIISILEHAGNR